MKQYEMRFGDSCITVNANDTDEAIEMILADPRSIPFKKRYGKLFVEWADDDTQAVDVVEIHMVKGIVQFNIIL